MRAFRSLGFEKLAWSLRRLHVPVPDDALVLEVGAGGNPYPRSNVLLDGYDETPERLEPNLVRDRPLVLGFAERLPFKDQSFDFVIASHILEHSPDPENFLRELMRVAKAGYIETPDAFFERINPYTYHRLEVTDDHDVIRIYKKPSWRPSTEIVDLYEKKMKDAKFLRFTSTHPEPFYMRHYWRGKIDFEIQNPEADASWPLPPEAYHHVVPTGVRATLRNTLLNTMRKLFSQNRRNQTIDVFELLRCPTCGAGDVQKTASAVVCAKCRAEYELRDGVPRMYPIDHARTA